MSTIHDLKEKLREEIADVMLLAARKEAGVVLTTDEYYRLKEKLMSLLIGEVML